MQPENRGDGINHDFISFSSSIFRAYDIRGIIGETLNPQDYFHIGRLLAAWAREQGFMRCVIGYDGRLSSPELADNLVQAVVSSGMQAIQTGLVPTPALYHAQQLTDAGLALMVTGSHNPPQYNGLKMMLGGKPFFGDDIAVLPQRARDHKFITDPKGGTQESLDIIPIYLQYLHNALDKISGNDSKLRLGWDPGNGASGEIITQLTQQLPGKHFVINGTIDGSFPAHHPDPSQPKNLVQLQELIAEHQLDFGIAFDGDGDRIGVVDARGRILYGDQLLPLLAFDVLAQHPGSIIMGDVKTSAMAFQQIEKYGGKAQMVATGHSLVKTAMRNLHATFAAEMSGHIFYQENHYFDDAIYAAIKLMNRVITSGVPLDILLDELPKTYHTPEVRITVIEEEKRQIMSNIIAAARKAKMNFVDIDGIRVHDGAHWWLIRASNTENVLVFRAEADTAPALQALRVSVASFLQNQGIDATAIIENS